MLAYNKAGRNLNTYVADLIDARLCFNLLFDTPTDGGKSGPSKLSHGIYVARAASDKF